MTVASSVLQVLTVHCPKEKLLKSERAEHERGKKEGQRNEGQESKYSGLCSREVSALSRLFAFFHFSLRSNYSQTCEFTRKGCSIAYCGGNTQC